MRWRKLGPTLLPAQRPAWMGSHAAVPFAEPVEGSVVRVYFSARDAHNRSHTGWALVDLKEPGRALELSTEPVLAPSAAHTTPTGSQISSSSQLAICEPECGVLQVISRRTSWL